ncbi:Uncharacterized protein dnl_13010 [Desulfonema limicola]|uniref:PglZ domain-containing protein n=1 Tax=Desulfonema limicola TaxID=45656 RepID=A0A975B5A5_9BACT|nr:hypothetical protein [Desulfonema limicola]QTA79052.1 Uncharacterized protein dnl_13010 [Desulfonema limicola]
MIEIIYDFYRLKSAGRTDIEIFEDTSYEECIRKIEEYAEKNEAVRIFVRNRGMFGWFDSIKKKYGARIEIPDPVQMLSEKMNFRPIPDFLKENPQWIVEFDLIEKIFESFPFSSESQSDENMIISVLLSPVWSRNHLDEDIHIIDLVLFFLHNKMDLSHPIFSCIIDRKFELWSKDSSKACELIRWLKFDPVKKSLYLIYEQLLSSYPESSIAEWFQHDGIWGHLSSFPQRRNIIPRIPPEKIEISLPPAVATYIRNFLKESWESNGPLQTTDYMSGKIEPELVFLLEQLRSQLLYGIPLNQEVYEKIAEISESEPQIEELARKLVPVKPPKMFGDDATLSEVQNWIDSEYLPYYSSCVTLKCIEFTIEAVRCFERWLQKNYSLLLAGGEGMAYRRITSLKKRTEETPLMIVAVDGLDFLTAQKELLPALAEKGLYPVEELISFFSFIPTETPIAKPALLRGKMPSQIQDEVPGSEYYRGLVQELFNAEPDDIEAATDKEMSPEELISQSARIYLYLDNRLDRDYLHAQFAPFIRQRNYANHAKMLAESLADAVLSAKELYGCSPAILICSDHGYTEFPDAQYSEIIKTETKAKSRSAEAPEQTLQSENIWKLSADLYGLNKAMLVAREYHCFNKRPKGAGHGGCTPQEIAVPWIVVSDTKPSDLIPVSLSIEGAIHRRRAENNVFISVSNPNSYEVSLIFLQIGKLDIENLLPIKVKAQGVYKIQTVFDASEVGENLLVLHGEYILKRIEQTINEKFRLEIETTGAMKNEFDDEFDEF